MHKLLKTMLLVFGLLILLPTFPAGAQNVVSDDEVNAVAKELYCPVCENTPLDVCPTQACQDWRDVIRTQLAEGRSPDEIKDYFALQYGDRVLAEPPAQGFNLLVWLLPIGAIFIGGVFFINFMHHLQQRSSVSPEQPSRSVDTEVSASANGQNMARDDYIARVEQELRNQSQS